MAGVSLTAAQIREWLGAELFSLCQGITAHGRLSRDELVVLGRWLDANRDAPLPGIDYLARTLDRIVADGRATRDELRELMQAIEEVLPPEDRAIARASRRAEEKAGREREAAKREPTLSFDFLVAGVGYGGRSEVVRAYLRAGDRVKIAGQPDNPVDDTAVAITLADGQMIGYVPRYESLDIWEAMHNYEYFIARVTKIIEGRTFPTPVIVLGFYRRQQFSAISDQHPDLCKMPPIPWVDAPEPRGPWWKLW